MSVQGRVEEGQPRRGWVVWQRWAVWAVGWLEAAQLLSAAGCVCQAHGLSTAL